MVRLAMLRMKNESNDPGRYNIADMLSYIPPTVQAGLPPSSIEGRGNFSINDYVADICCRNYGNHVKVGPASSEEVVQGWRYSVQIVLGSVVDAEILCSGC